MPSGMSVDAIPTAAYLAVAGVGILVLAFLSGRRKRRRDPQRLFSWEQKKTLMMQARGRCEHKPLLWHRCRAVGRHADHLVPWSRGGTTQLVNGQLLCARHNYRKSNRALPPLYRWRLARRRRKY